MEKFHSLNGRTQDELERFTTRPLPHLPLDHCHKNNLVYRSTAITLYLEWIDLARRYRKSTVSNQNQSQLLKQTAGVVRISWQALGFSIIKCFISFRQRLEMSKGKNTFHEWKRSKRPSMSYPRAKHTRFKPTLTSGKRLLWYFWRAMLEVKKKTPLN